MSDTPETDEQINGKPCTRFEVIVGNSLRDAWVPSEFARKLERERNMARKETKEAWEEIAEACQDWLDSIIQEPSVDFIKAIRDWAKRKVEGK